MQRRHYTEEEKNTVMSQYAMCGGEVKAMLRAVLSHAKWGEQR